MNSARLPRSRLKCVCGQLKWCHCSHSQKSPITYIPPPMPSLRSMAAIAPALLHGHREKGLREWKNWLFDKFATAAPVQQQGSTSTRADVLHALDLALALVGFESVKQAERREPYKTLDDMCDAAQPKPFKDLCKLYKAIELLDEAIVEPLLVPKKMNHRPPATWEETRVKQTLVGCYIALKARDL